MTPGTELTRRAALGLMGVGTLAGCGLATDPTIRPGLDVEDEPRERTNRIPRGPAAGASPEGIIAGFIHAGATTGEGLKATRAFLTAVLASDGWIPDSKTVIYSGSEPKITRVWTAANTYRTRVRVLATIDSEGRYAVAPPNLWETFTFVVQEVEGEWRIDELDDGFGRLLAPREVRFLFEDYPVHYPAIGWNALVVDQRWFPQDQLATRLARAQLGRTPEYLKGAVTTDDGAELAVDAVPVREGVAQVDLDRATIADDATSRRQLAAQLVATLMSLREVAEVVITISGSPMDLDVDGALTTPEQLGFTDRTQTNAPTVLARRGTKVVQVGHRLASLTSRGMQRADSEFEPLSESSQLLALRPDGKELAEVNRSGTEVTRYRTNGTVVDVPSFAADMTRPCYDYRDVLWLGGSGLGRETGHRLWAINATADPDDTAATAPKHVAAPWLGERLVISAVVSPEGGRIAVISEARRGMGSTLEVSGVIRKANGLPTETSSSSFRIAADLVEMIDAVWVGESTLAVIGRRDKQTLMQPYLVDVGGRTRPLTPRPGTAMVTTTGDDEDVVLTSRQGRVFQKAGGRWQEIKPVDGVVVAGA